MKDRLTREEVLHVAELSRIEISEEEIDSYSVKLQKLLDDVGKISDIVDNDSDYMICPWKDNAILRNDEVGEMLEPKEVLKNAPRKSGNYIEVPVVINE